MHIDHEYESELYKSSSNAFELTIGQATNHQLYLQLSTFQINHALSEDIAHPTVYHHLSQLSVDIQLSGMIKCREKPGVQTLLTQIISHSLGWISHEATVL